MKTFILLVFIICAIGFMSLKAESATVFSKELNLLGGYSKSDGFIDQTGMLKNSIGAEYYRRFSSDRGDFMTFDIQPRISYRPTEKFKDAWAFELHNAWLEYKLGFGYRLRAGHFDPSFGLEPTVDTHGTILQTIIMKNIGFESDWGIGFKGAVGPYDYEASLQNGSGMKLKRKDGNFLLTYRIGNPQERDNLYGLSVMYGKVLRDNEMLDSMAEDVPTMSDMPVKKKRIGLDTQIQFRSFMFKGELAYGTDDSMDVLGSFAQLGYTVPSYQALIAELQMQNWLNGFGDDRVDETMIGFCISYRLTSKIALRTAYNYTFSKDNQVFFQFYYFGS